MKTFALECLLVSLSFGALALPNPLQTIDSEGSQQLSTAYLSLVNQTFAQHVFSSLCRDSKSSRKTPRIDKFNAVYNLELFNFSRSFVPDSLVGIMGQVLLDSPQPAGSLAPNEDEEIECGICAATPKQVYFTGCGHGLCLSCELQCKRTNLKCPYCRAYTQGVQIIKGNELHTGHEGSSHTLFIPPASGFLSTLQHYEQSLNDVLTLLKSIQENSGTGAIFKSALPPSQALLKSVSDPRTFMAMVKKNQLPPNFLVNVVDYLSYDSQVWLIVEFHDGGKTSAYALMMMLYYFCFFHNGCNLTVFLTEVNKYLPFKRMRYDNFDQRGWNTWDNQLTAFLRVQEAYEDMIEETDKDQYPIFQAMLSAIKDLKMTRRFTHYLCYSGPNKVQSVLSVASKERIKTLLQTLEIPSNDKLQLKYKGGFKPFPYFAPFNEIHFNLDLLTKRSISTIQSNKLTYSSIWEELSQAHVTMMAHFETMVTTQTVGQVTKAQMPDVLDKIALSMAVGPKLISDLKWYADQLVTLFKNHTKLVDTTCAVTLS
jgi:hypothetical protein